jgi:uncharacterized protein (DUF433 family)
MMKRQNFNITPEQEAEIASLRELIDASSTKDAILSAVRFYAVIAQQVREGQQVYLATGKEGPMEKIVVPELEPLRPPRYTYLVQRPHKWKRQLYVKGRRLPATVVYSDYLLEQRTPQQLAKDWELPVEAIQECINYCQENQELLQMESDEESRQLAENS